MLVLTIAWVLLGTLAALLVARSIRSVSAQEDAPDWAEFCAAHPLDDVALPEDPARA